MVGLSLFPPPVVFVAGENALKKRKEDIEKFTDDCSRGGEFLFVRCCCCRQSVQFYFWNENLTVDRTEGQGEEQGEEHEGAQGRRR